MLFQVELDSSRQLSAIEYLGKTISFTRDPLHGRSEIDDADDQYMTIVMRDNLIVKAYASHIDPSSEMVGIVTGNTDSKKEYQISILFSNNPSRPSTSFSENFTFDVHNTTANIIFFMASELTGGND